MMENIIQLRRRLHQYPELSGNEIQSAQTVLDFFIPLKPDKIIKNLGGNGLAFVFGKNTGKTILLRCELDALPIQESGGRSWRSKYSNIGHQCGHDGHMAVLAAAGKVLSQERPAAGRVVLLYQPQEENGKGAEAVINDPKFQEIKPDFAFALHNLPGYPLGQVVVKPGIFSCASRGMEIRLEGKTAHAAQPGTGISPAAAMCRIINEFNNPQTGIAKPNETAFATVTGARLGGKAFGTAPGQAEIWAVIRSESDKTMLKLIHQAEQYVKQEASIHELKASIQYDDIFYSTGNDEQAVDIVIEAAGSENLHIPEKPFLWSEDFGRFAAISKGAYFGIGAGMKVPDLHNPDYDFPDDLIPIAAAIYRKIIQASLTQYRLFESG